MVQQVECKELRFSSWKSLAKLLIKHRVPCAGCIIQTLVGVLEITQFKWNSGKDRRLEAS